MRDASKSSMRSLVEYICDEKDNEVRVGEIKYTNLGATTPELAIKEMLNTQGLNTRSKANKTYHLMLSFPDGEQPPPEQIHEMEEKICAALGFSEHQRLSVIHRDTKNLHIHIAINKIHPETFAAHSPYNDWLKIQKTCAKLEQEYGLQITNHKSAKTKAQNMADNIEHHTGIETFLNWLERNGIADNIRLAQSWQELHELLAADGVAVKKHGNGLNFVAIKEKINVKASSLGREFSKANLEKRLGEFEAFKPPNNANNANSAQDFNLNDELKNEQTEKENSNKKQTSKSKNEYRKKPVFNKIDTTDFYQKYLQEKNFNFEKRTKLIPNLRIQKQQEIAAIWREFKAQKSNKKLTYKQTIDQVRSVKQKYAQKRKEIYAKHKKYKSKK